MATRQDAPRDSANRLSDLRQSLFINLRLLSFPLDPSLTPDVLLTSPDPLLTLQILHFLLSILSLQPKNAPQLAFTSFQRRSSRSRAKTRVFGPKDLDWYRTHVSRVVSMEPSSVDRETTLASSRRRPRSQRQSICVVERVLRRGSGERFLRLLWSLSFVALEMRYHERFSSDSSSSVDTTAASTNTFFHQLYSRLSYLDEEESFQPPSSLRSEAILPLYSRLVTRRIISRSLDLQTLRLRTEDLLETIRSETQHVDSQIEDLQAQLAPSVLSSTNAITTDDDDDNDDNDPIWNDVSSIEHVWSELEDLHSTPSSLLTRDYVDDVLCSKTQGSKNLKFSRSYAENKRRTTFDADEIILQQLSPSVNRAEFTVLRDRALRPGSTGSGSDYEYGEEEEGEGEREEEITQQSEADRIVEQLLREADEIVQEEARRRRTTTRKSRIRVIESRSSNSPSPSPSLSSSSPTGDMDDEDDIRIRIGRKALRDAILCESPTAAKGSSSISRNPFFEAAMSRSVNDFAERKKEVEYVSLTRLIDATVSRLQALVQPPENFDESQLEDLSASFISAFKSVDRHRDQDQDDTSGTVGSVASSSRTKRRRNKKKKRIAWASLSLRSSVASVASTTASVKQERSRRLRRERMMEEADRRSIYEDFGLVLIRLRRIAAEGLKIERSIMASFPKEIDDAAERIRGKIEQYRSMLAQRE